MSHYSLAQMTKSLNLWSIQMALDILHKQVNQPVLVYSGMSGIAAATALSLALNNIDVQFGMVYVRKRNEESHGENVEVEIPYGFDSPTYVFVDDFICDGITKRWCESKLDGEKFTYAALQKQYGCHVENLITC